MPNPATWVPTKAERWKGTWRGSRDSRQLHPSSRIAADLLVQAYERALRSHARGVLVDLGCGQAPYFGIYRDLVERAIGVDWEASAHSSDHVDIKCDLNKGIGLGDGVADTIFCTDVLEHIYEPRVLLLEINRVLRPGGSLILGVPFLYWIHEAPFDYHRYTSFALRRYAEDAGLSVVSIDAVGGLPYVIADLVCKAFRRSLELSSFIQKMFRFVLQYVGRTNQSAETQFPLAYVVIARKDDSVAIS